MSDRRRFPWGLRARRRSRDERQRALRLANSIRVPFAVGLSTLLILAVGVAALVGRTGDDPLQVPRAVLDTQQFQAVATAQSVRKSLNEGVADLEGLAATVAGLSAGEPRADASGLERALRGFVAAHGRYASVVVLDASAQPLATVRRSQPVEWRRGEPPATRGIEPGAKTPSGRPPVVHQFAPIGANGFGAEAVVARYDPAFLRFPLQSAEPGNAWIVDRAGRVLGALGDPARLEPLPRPGLRAAARRSAQGETGARSLGGSLDRQEVVAWAPVAGIGPAGGLDWSVITTRSVSSFAFPQVDARRQALLAGVILAVLTVLIFAWLWIVVISPVLGAQREAERLAFGDLSKPVEVVRYDEIGLIGRSLERMRVLLIRKRVQK